MFVKGPALLLGLLLVFACEGNAQKKLLNLRADSVRISSSCDTAELILENRTRNLTNGVLSNKGAGITEFRKVLEKINDSLYLVGGDTLRLQYTDTQYCNKNVYYVSRQFAGIAKASIGGYTIASVTSPNDSYVLQLQRARPGSLRTPYPDPYAARNAAMEDLHAGRISSAHIIVMPGNAYSIGSDDSTKNGTADGLSPNNGSLSDLQFAKTKLDADTSLSSLLKNGIDFYFSEASSLRFINSSYPIYACFNNDTLNFRSSIYGKGDFFQVYG